MKFGKFADEDYQVDEFTISGLELEKPQVEELKTFYRTTGFYQKKLVA